jgi:hypothetical protein
MMGGRIGSEWSWFLGAMYVVSSAQTMLISRVNCVLAGRVIDSERRNNSDAKSDGSGFAI